MIQLPYDFLNKQVFHGNKLLLLTDDDNLDYNPDWSPDGSKIIYLSKRDGTPEIYMMNLDGSDPIRLTDNTNIESNPDWKP